ncbi:MAG: hypothetical protein NWE92_10705 [Candidatus Bathyarchaeota archaeon]|nr:hypothetical protein [Candidatus Bathyarchaeota archaeon]
MSEGVFVDSRQGNLSIFVIAFLVLLMVDANLVAYGVANPYMITGQVPPDQETYPPTINVASPNNNTAYNTSRVSLAFNVTAPQSRTASFTTVQRVTYQTDWKKDTNDILQGCQEQATFNLLLSNVPEGQHNIVINAVGMGFYTNEKELTRKEFFISSTATISFTIDRTAPTVSVLPPENVSSTSEVPLNLTVSKAYSKIAYSLNGQQNVTVNANSTMSPLPAGEYNITVYAWDTAGNLGASETEYFSVAAIPPAAQAVEVSLIVPAAGALLTAVVIVGVVLFFKKRSHASK